MPLRRAVLSLGLLLLASACAPSPGPSDGPSADASSEAVGAAASPSDGPAAAGDPPPCTPSTDLPGGDVASAPRDDVAFFPWELERDEVTRVEGFDEAEIRRGGPPPDGIRPIEHDEACFDRVADADAYLSDQAPVLAIEVDGDVRAYPLGILTQHEIVNDVLAGVPVVVTYCPLCNSGLAFERTVDGEVLTFGTSGRLFRSNLVMYDRQHRNLWAQFSGEAVVGKVDDDLTGTRLVRIPTSLLGWAEFRDLAPDGLVLSPKVNPERDYTRNPYPGYDDIGIGFGLYSGPRDDRLEPNTRVVGLGADVDPVAVPLARLMVQGTVDLDIDGRPVSVWWAPGTSSALDGRQVDDGRDVGQTVSVVALGPTGERLDFAPSPDDPTLFVDAQTGSRWNLFGRAVDGELAGTQLEVVARDDTFWFVWFAFQPETTVADEG